MGLSQPLQPQGSDTCQHFCHSPYTENKSILIIKPANPLETALLQKLQGPSEPEKSSQNKLKKKTKPYKIKLSYLTEGCLPAGRGGTFCPMHVQILPFFCAAAGSQTLNTNSWKTPGAGKLKSTRVAVAGNPSTLETPGAARGFCDHPLKNIFLKKKKKILVFPSC